MGSGRSKHQQDDGDRVLVAGRPDLERCDNMITTSKYTVWNFVPIAVGEQFRRFANMYFLIVGSIMAVGYYFEHLFQSAISPWTTFGPLAFVVSVSLLVEGVADKKRHKSDELTNNFPCIVIKRSEEIEAEENAVKDAHILGGKDVVVSLAKSYALTSRNGPQTPVAASSDQNQIVKVGFQTIRRMEIRQGHFVLVRNREMVPADMVLLASSGDNGSAYIETSSIDGETNLKLRTSPQLSKKLLRHLRDGTPMEEGDDDEDDGPGYMETLEQAAKRITRFSCFAYPNGTSALEVPRRKKSPVPDKTHYVATLTSEPPNPHVNTFSGKLTLPPITDGGEAMDIALGAENLLLRGAVLRNTEWAIGLSCFTGTDTKLVQNSFDTPSKFSQLDILMNKTVVLVIILMVLCISYLATQAVVSNDQQFNNLWYLGLERDNERSWPYLQDLPPPRWANNTPNWLQMFFLYVTLLSNLVPLSMYVTVEAINFFFLYLIYVDKDMYDAKTDTRALARSTNITDLGQVQYVFSDKTGTLTQNVMRFKRCSVDGMIFGAPIQKSRPGAEEEDREMQSSFHPARHLLVGRVDSDGNAATSHDGELTFNVEMFLRVMSLCHTVVVEKDLDLNDGIDAAESVTSKGSSMSKMRGKKQKSFFKGNRGRTSSDMSMGSTGLEPLSEDGGPDGNRTRATSAGSFYVPNSMEKAADGAPVGYAYQAESPDEGALVSEASNSFGFQVVGRDSSGIKLRCAHPTILTDQNIIDSIKKGTVNLKKLAADSASGTSPTKDTKNEEIEEYLQDPSMQRLETWSIIAVNKFDSERKRMSILLRSPPELGSITMLLCKGADSAMLDPAVCTGAENLVSADLNESQLSSLAEINEAENEDEWEMAQMLGIQSHLGEFASEGLRTLVLGVRFLTDEQCEKWLDQYKTAATSIKDRDELLKDAAYAIETNLHIVGATAIEDKLQVGVPKTIATLEKAGIKLWVLTGDKRETAIEIGYSTQVLTSKMHLTEVADNGADLVRAQCAMEFMRLVKQGKLPLYQRAAVDRSDDGWSRANASFALSKLGRYISRFFRSMLLSLQLLIGKLLGRDPAVLQAKAETMKAEVKAETDILKDVVRRRNVRNRAENIIQDFLKTPEGKTYSRSQRRLNASNGSEGSDEVSNDDDVPVVFGRAQSARELLKKRKSEGRLPSVELRNISLAQLTAQEAEDHEHPVIDEDTLSLNSFLPTAGDAQSDFDRRRRTVFERLFAVDRSVRKGKLVKHLKKDKRAEVLSLSSASRPHHAGTHEPRSGDGPRALVIEGAALKHLLGDSELEELIFSIASKCDAVIACRVSPRQKALLVKLVRHHVVPEPVTLAIGDGANDVGMIQEAHVGVGISGKEGKQAVNASDFAIAQFRFLETLVLIHGRWSFFRLSTVVLFSFYNNAVMAGCLIVFNGETLFSGTPLFDEWVIAVLNFVAGVPIALLGLFDRCLDKEYIRKHPEVYQPTRDNELITSRVFLRWVILTFGHIFCLYYGCIPSLSQAGGTTSAFKGLTREGDENVGDGEGGDLQSVGLVAFTCMILLLAYKVLYESRSLIHGRFPAFTCSKTVKEGFWSRVPYTWYGVTYGSIVFYLMFLWIYEIIGERGGPGTYFNMVGVVSHMFSTRTINWLAILFLPMTAIAFDVAGKAFGNMFYPTQTQIHVEIEAKEVAAKRKEAAAQRRLEGHPHEHPR